jgi:peptide deformylase
MALRDIITLPDKRLRQVSKPVGKIDQDLRRLIDDMFETMYEAPGIGLAAIQVGVPKRVITMDLAKKDEPKNPQVFINPEILWTSEERATYEEGCLSIPDLPAARDRSPQRRAVHRPFVQAQAQPRDQEIRQGGQARRRRRLIHAGLRASLLAFIVIPIGFNPVTWCRRSGICRLTCKGM